MTKEALTKEALTKEALTKEALTKEALTKEALGPDHTGQGDCEGDFGHILNVATCILTVTTGSAVWIKRTVE